MILTIRERCVQSLHHVLDQGASLFEAVKMIELLNYIDSLVSTFYDSVSYECSVI